LNCPSCDVSLVEKHVATIAIDFCNSCQGIWFDAGELSEYQSILSLTDAGEPDEKNKFERALDASTQVCPKCETVSPHAGAFSGYSMSQCQECKGVFVPTTTLHSFGFRPGTALFGHAADTVANTAFDSLFRAVGRLIAGALDGSLAALRPSACGRS